MIMIIKPVLFSYFNAMVSAELQYQYITVDTDISESEHLSS